MFKDPNGYGIKDCCAFKAFAALLTIVPLILTVGEINLWSGLSVFFILIGDIAIDLTLYWIVECKSAAGTEYGDYKAHNLIAIGALASASLVTFCIPVNIAWRIAAMLPLVDWKDIKEGGSFLKKRYSL